MLTLHMLQHDSVTTSCLSPTPPPATATPSLSVVCVVVELYSSDIFCIR